MVAAGDDPTVIHLNPAALAFLTGTNFSLGSTVMLPELSFTGAAPGSLETKMQPQVIFPPDLYLSHTFGESWGMGIAIHEPYSTRTEWTPDWIGSRLVTKSDIRVLMVTPSLGMRVRKNLAVGLGLNIVFPKLLYEKRIPLGDGNFGAPIPAELDPWLMAEGSSFVPISMFECGQRPWRFRTRGPDNCQ